MLHEQIRPKAVVSRETTPVVSRDTTEDDLSRNVYCILGIPVDSIDLLPVIRRIESAAERATPFFLSTPNLNYLVAAQFDPDFLESMLLSDLSPADGVSIVLIARLMGVPIKRRVPGADIFAALKARRSCKRPLKVFLFGGDEGVAATASHKMNSDGGGICCVGLLDPGRGSVEELSRREMIDEINSSGADFLVTCLGSRKGQLWLRHNRDKLRVPVRAHLGAVLKFEAGAVKRAPHLVQKFGLEWLWRIKEEPYLWRRYLSDANVLLRLLQTHVLPLAIRRLKQKRGRERGELSVTQIHEDTRITIKISGPAVSGRVDAIVPAFRIAIASKKDTRIDLSKTCAIDTRFLGLLLMLRKNLKKSGVDLTFVGLSPDLRKIFELHGVGFLLASAGAKSSARFATPGQATSC